MAYSTGTWNFTDRGGLTSYDGYHRAWKVRRPQVEPMKNNQGYYDTTLNTFPMGSFTSCRYGNERGLQRKSEQNNWHLPSVTPAPEEHLRSVIVNYHPPSNNDMTVGKLRTRALHSMSTSKLPSAQQQMERDLQPRPTTSMDNRNVPLYARTPVPAPKVPLPLLEHDEGVRVVTHTKTVYRPSRTSNLNATSSQRHSSSSTQSLNV